MRKLTICPDCGKKNLEYNGRKMHCPDCGFTFYNNTAAAVAVLMTRGEQFLLTVRNQEPGKGLLDLPGGFIDYEETAEQAGARELHEELHIAIDPSRLKYLTSLPNVYPYKGIEYHTMDLFYEYPVSEDFEMTLEKSELQAVLWVKRSEMTLDKVVFESQKRFFKYFLEKE